MNARAPWSLVLIAGVFLPGPAGLVAAPITGWLIGQNNAGANLSLTAAETASPVWGNNAAGNADATSIYAPIPETALAGVGDRVTLSGSATLSGITASGAQFRWGLFHTNGSADTNGCSATSRAMAVAPPEAACRSAARATRPSTTTRPARPRSRLPPPRERRSPMAPIPFHWRSRAWPPGSGSIPRSSACRMAWPSPATISSTRAPA